MKKNVTRLIISILATPFLFACSSEKIFERGTCYIEEDVEVLTANNFISNIKVIPLEISEDFLLGRIDKIIKEEGKFYILDDRYNKSMFIYSNEGKALKKFKEVGQAANEYMQIIDFDINGDIIALLCYPTKLIFLDKESLNICQEEIFFHDKFYNRIIFKDGNLWLYDHASGIIDMIDLQSRKVKNVFNWESMQGYIFYPQPVFHKINNRLFLQASGDNTIYEIENSSFQLYLTLEYEKKENARNYYSNKKIETENLVNPNEISEYPLPDIISIFKYNEDIAFIYSFSGLFRINFPYKNNNQRINKLMPADLYFSFPSVAYNENKLISWNYPYNLNDNNVFPKHITIEGFPIDQKNEDDGVPVILEYILK